MASSFPALFSAPLLFHHRRQRLWPASCLFSPPAAVNSACTFDNPHTSNSPQVMPIPHFPPM